MEIVHIIDIRLIIRWMEKVVIVSKWAQIARKINILVHVLGNWLKSVHLVRVIRIRKHFYRKKIIYFMLTHLLSIMTNNQKNLQFDSRNLFWIFFPTNWPMHYQEYVFCLFFCVFTSFSFNSPIKMYLHWQIQTKI